MKRTILMQFTHHDRQAGSTGVLALTTLHVAMTLTLDLHVRSGDSHDDRRDDARVRRNGSLEMELNRIFQELTA
jgi:hypothetical protein